MKALLLAACLATAAGSSADHRGRGEAVAPAALLAPAHRVRLAAAVQIGGPAPAAAAPAPSAPAAYKLPVPKVHHKKAPGRGYKKGSPLFKMQQEIVELTKPMEVPPVSSAMWAIMGLSCQYTLVYMLLFVVNTVNKFFEHDKPLAMVEKILVGTVETVHFCPMLCVLFLAVRMRAIQLAQRETVKYGLPQAWVQWTMLLVQGAVVLQTLFAIIYSFQTNRKFEMHEQSLQTKSSPLMMVFLVCRYIIVFAIYVGFAGVCIGLVLMPAPVEVWGEDGGPPVSPTMQCIMVLCCLFFGVYLVHQVAHTMNEIRSKPTRFGCGINTLSFALETVQLAPMLCVLMLAVRMRALQINPYNGNPQWWAQWMFYLATAMITLQTVLVFCSMFCDAPTQKDEWGEVCYMAPRDMGEKKMSSTILEVARLASLFLMYLAIIVIMVSVFLIEHPDGPESTPIISPAMWNVLFCTQYYFIVHILLWIALTARKYSHACMELADFLWGPARDSVAFCPILCVLFIGMRIRALQITNNKGAPQWWAQWAMSIATASTLFQAISRVDVLLDRMREKPLPNASRAFCVVLQYVGLSVMYVSGITICVALFIITPETATGRGSTLPDPGDHANPAEAL